MADADLVITGTVLTVDDARPTAEALAVADGRIVAVGTRSDVGALVGPSTQTIDVGDGCVMPGFVEAHGHPLMEAVALSDRIVDIRPVSLAKPDDVLAAIHREVANRGSDGAYLNGWDALLQSGLPTPTLAWLDTVAPDSPLVIIHNSGHKAYFNSHAAQLNGLSRDTPDPKGASYGRDADGELDGSAEEIGAVFPLIGGARRLPGDAARRMRPTQPRGADDLFRDGVRPELWAAGGATSRRAHRPAAHLRGLQCADVDRRHARPG
jgi:predicted amidohydrolase YtcJ